MEGWRGVKHHRLLHEDVPEWWCLNSDHTQRKPRKGDRVDEQTSCCGNFLHWESLCGRAVLKGGLQGSAAPAGCGVPRQVLSWPSILRDRLGILNSNEQKHPQCWEKEDTTLSFPWWKGELWAWPQPQGEKRGPANGGLDSFKTFQLCKLHTNTLRRIVTKE